jgi:hypothetical protein
MLVSGGSQATVLWQASHALVVDGCVAGLNVRELTPSWQLAPEQLCPDTVAWSNVTFKKLTVL